MATPSQLADHGKWMSGSKPRKLHKNWCGAPVCFRINPTNNLKIDLEKVDPEVEEMRGKLEEYALLAADASKYRRSKKELHTKYKIDATRFEADYRIQLKKNRKLTDIAAHAYQNMDEKQRVLLQKTADRGSDDHMKAELRNCSLLDVKDQDIEILREKLAASKEETRLALESKIVYIEKRPKAEEPPKKRRRVDFDVQENPDNLMNLDDFLARCKVVAKAAEPKNRIKRALLITKTYLPRAAEFKKKLDTAINKPKQPWTVTGRGGKKRLPRCRGTDKPKYKLMSAFMKKKKKEFETSQSMWCKGEKVTKRLICFMRKTQGQPLVHDFLKNGSTRGMQKFNTEAKKLKCKKKITALLQKHMKNKDA